MLIDGVKFYTVNSSYLDYLRGYEGKVPEVEKQGTNAKPYCGIVMQINEILYFVPLSSFNRQQRTNIVIVDESEGKRLSSLRFSFMVPITTENFPKVFSYLDFSVIQDTSYVNLLEKEYRYCKDNEEDIKKKALEIYNKVISGDEFFCMNCCNFKLLEDKAKLYFI